MADPYRVYVTRDDRIPEHDYAMGLELLYERDDVEVTFLPDRESDTVATEELVGADAVISLEDLITAETLDGLDDLKIVARFGSGLDNVDIPACTARDLPVVNSPMGVGEAVAEATLGMLLACSNNFVAYNQSIRETEFDERFDYPATGFFEKTLGLVGMGLIGREVVKLVEPFDVDIQVYDPYISDEVVERFDVETTGLEELVESSDYISFHCPLTEETRGMVTREHFQRMNENAYIVNTTRGGIYKDEDLAHALEQDWIAGAAIDVFEGEPDVEDNPLMAFDDILLTPHCAGVNLQGLRKTGESVSRSILQVFAGEIPDNIVNPNIYDDVPSEKLSPSHG